MAQPPFDSRDQAALILAYELELLTELHFRRIYHLEGPLSDGQVNTRLRQLVAAGFLERAKPPSTLPPQRVPYLYQVTQAAHAYLPTLGPGRHHRHHQPLQHAKLLPTHTGHTLAVADFALSVLGLLPRLVQDSAYYEWHGEQRTRIELSGKEFLAPDGSLLLWQATQQQFYYECDRGTEYSKRDWAPKIARYARRAKQLPATTRLSPLFVTCPDEATLQRIALYLGQVGGTHPLLTDWEVWIALQDEVATPTQLEHARWRQVQIHARVTEVNVLCAPAWTLAQIVHPNRPLVPLAQIRKRQRDLAEAQAQEAAARAREAEARRAEAARVAAERAEADRRERAIEAGARAEAARLAYEAKLRAVPPIHEESLYWVPATNLYTQSTPNRLAAMGQAWQRMPVEVRRFYGWMFGITIGGVSWWQIFTNLTPTIEEVAATEYVLIDAPFWHWLAGLNSPQGWWLLVTASVLWNLLQSGLNRQ